jgi:hypothetical protein
MMSNNHSLIPAMAIPQLQLAARTKLYLDQKARYLPLMYTQEKRARYTAGII